MAKKMENEDMQEKTFMTCLRRLGKNTKYLVISLEDKDKMTIGRLNTNDIVLLSPVVSKHHCVLTKTDNRWTITDCKSLNGTFVNGSRLTEHTWTDLEENDEIQVGVPVQPGAVGEFRWTFHAKLKVRLKHKPVSSSNTNGKRLASPDQNLGKRQKLDTSLEDIEKKHDAIRQEAEARVREMQEEIKKKETEMQEMLSKKEKEIEKRLKQQAEQLEALQKREKEATLHLEAQKAQAEVDKQALEREFEEKLRRKETEMTERSRADRERLLMEREVVEASLMEQLATRMEEKEQHEKDELRRQKEQLDHVIEQKEAKARLLENELSVKCEEGRLQAKRDIISNLSEIMETELQCSICNELFVEATSLQCSHSYCAYCLEQWSSHKAICPICRQPITSKIRSRVLDSYIDKVSEHLSDDMKKRRQEMLKEREEVKKALEASKKKPTKSPGARGRGRGGRRAGRGRGRGRGPPAAAAPAAPEVVYTVSSDSESSSDSDSGTESSSLSSHNTESMSSVEGDAGAYYGGYGTCYNCGRRGHWSNGCPDRY